VCALNAPRSKMPFQSLQCWGLLQCVMMTTKAALRGPNVTFMAAVNDIPVMWARDFPV